MPTKRRRSTAGRYSLDRCIIEIAAMRDARGMQDKEIAHACGISPPQFSHKMANASRSSFSVEELGRIADYFAQETGRLLPGWPFVSERECALVERALRPGGSGASAR
jgi:transcriptional regulator with XRE-family HTH domain